MWLARSTTTVLTPAAGQEPGLGAVPAADIDDGAAAFGGKAAGDEGMDVTSCGEPLGGGLIGGETTGIDVVVAGQRLSCHRFRSLLCAHGMGVPIARMGRTTGPAAGVGSADRRRITVTKHIRYTPLTAHGPRI
jgi:hypothetical protein